MVLKQSLKRVNIWLAFVKCPETRLRMNADDAPCLLDVYFKRLFSNMFAFLTYQQVELLVTTAKLLQIQ